jgi:adenylate cyclase
METRSLVPEAIAAALDRISASKTFSRAERHRCLLRHLVERTAAGRAGEIKEATIALEVFGRDSYDPQIDSQVRVEVTKLRDRLDRYYGTEGSSDPIRIEIPRGRYEPVFHDIRTKAEPAAAPSEKDARRWSRTAIVSIGVGVAAAAVLMAGLLTPRSGQTTFKPGIAILPFEDLSAAKDLDYFCSGIAEELTNDLTALQIFRVLPRSSVTQFRERRDARTIGKELGVHAVVEGSVRKAGDKIRVSVRLVDTREGFQIWNNTYDHELGNILEAQRDIAEAVAKSFHLELPETRLALTRHRARNSEAYLHYLRASYFYPSEPDRAVQFYRAAAAADPNYAAAWAGLAAS